MLKTGKVDAATVCLLDLATGAWQQAAECFTWNESAVSRGSVQDVEKILIVG